MSPSWIVIKLLMVVALLFLSGFFSGSETALFSLDPFKVKRLSQKGRAGESLQRLLNNPMRSLMSILLGNTLVNIAISAIMASVLLDFLGPAGVSVSIFVTTFILLVFGEITPKILAIHNNEKIATLISWPLCLFSRMMAPVLRIGEMVGQGLLKGMRLPTPADAFLTQEELKTVIELGHRHGVVGKSEKEMVVSVLELTQTTAEDIMTPRMDIKAVSASWTREKTVSFARDVKHSRLPVYRETPDNICGILTVKDLFLETEKSVMEMMRPVYFIPSTKKINELLKDFERRQTTIAIVVDEYGGTDGLVTAEDIQEEIFGEIHSEFQVPEEGIIVLKEGVFRVNAKVSVDQLNQACRLSIPQGEYETVAGFLLDRLGMVPSEGDRFEMSEAVFMVEKMSGRRIKTVLVERRA